MKELIIPEFMSTGYIDERQAAFLDELHSAYSKIANRPTVFKIELAEGYPDLMVSYKKDCLTAHLRIYGQTGQKIEFTRDRAVFISNWELEIPISYNGRYSPYNPFRRYTGSIAEAAIDYRKALIWSKSNLSDSVFGPEHSRASRMIREKFSDHDMLFSMIDNMDLSEDVINKITSEMTRPRTIQNGIC